jgi:mono/diheme cytochrome c family protein
MRRPFAWSLKLTLCGLGLLLSSAIAADTPALSGKAERGRYLVEEVAQCQMCHTPRLESGEYDRQKWLKGATLNIQPIEPVKEWHKSAPDLTPGSRLWTRWQEKGLLTFMQTGLNPNGHAADPPMPTYKLKTEDAEAVVEYLKTLK